MTKTKIYEIEILNDEQLDQVSGSTVAEVQDIIRKMEQCSGGAGVASDFARAIINRLPKYRTVAKAAMNISYKSAAKLMLHRMGIKSDLSIGLAGTGLFESKNTYELNGRSLTHAEVLAMIK